MELLEHVYLVGLGHSTPAHNYWRPVARFYSTINRNPKAWALTIGAAEYLLKWIPKGTHQHDTFIKPSELSAMARQSGLEVVWIGGGLSAFGNPNQYPFANQRYQRELHDGLPQIK